MRILFILLAVLGAVVVLVLVIGAFLPHQHRVSREITLRRSPQEIFFLVRDFGSAPNLAEPIEEMWKCSSPLTAGFASVRNRKTAT